MTEEYPTRAAQVHCNTQNRSLFLFHMAGIAVLTLCVNGTSMAPLVKVGEAIFLVVFFLRYLYLT